MKKKSVILAAVVLLVLCIGAVAGWSWYDANVDRSGWETTENGTYYKDFHGDYISGWQDIDGKRYYFNEPDRGIGESYVMVTGWLDIGDDHYYMDADGVMQTGWVSVDSQLLCFGEDGKMLTGWQEKDGVLCYLQSDGTLASGWIEDNGQRYYLDGNGSPVIGWQELSGKRYYFQENGTMLTGWAEFSGLRYCFGEDGKMLTGWNDIGDKRYYFNDDGSMYTGWLQEDGKSYYLHTDGTMAVGPNEIDGATYYFSPHGVHILLVNPWNYVPEGYEVELVWTERGYQVSTECYDALTQMLADCRAAGHYPMMASGYRTQTTQIMLYQRKVDFFRELGYSEANAKVEAAKYLAIPGTSEHQLGLAVDIIDSYYTNMDDAQADTATQQWLMEHCHEYGFILRYPKDTTPITGIIYEPWHYRYLGVEIATEIVELGVTLEEYLDAVVTE